MSGGGLKLRVTSLQASTAMPNPDAVVVLHLAGLKADYRRLYLRSLRRTVQAGLFSIVDEDDPEGPVSGRIRRLCAVQPGFEAQAKQQVLDVVPLGESLSEIDRLELYAEGVTFVDAEFARIIALDDQGLF